jgi:hypothetical protein
MIIKIVKIIKYYKYLVIMKMSNKKKELIKYYYVKDRYKVIKHNNNY